MILQQAVAGAVVAEADVAQHVAGRVIELH
jgi:hypothetical protein